MGANSEHHSSLCGSVLLHQFPTPGSCPSSSNDGLWYGISHQINPFLSKFLLVRMFHHSNRNQTKTVAVLDISYCLQIFIFGGRDTQQKLTSFNMELKVVLTQGGRCWKRETDGSCWGFTTSLPEHQEWRVPRTDLSVGWMCLQVTQNTKSIVWRRLIWV